MFVILLTINGQIGQSIIIFIWHVQGQYLDLCATRR